MSSSPNVRVVTPDATTRNWYRTARVMLILAGLAILAVAFSAAMLLVSLLTLFRTRRFCQEVLGKWLGRSVLRLFGTTLIVHRNQPWPEGQAVYIANHTSTLDAFILLAAGLPRSRFFLSGSYRNLPPIRIVAWCIGIFFTCPQSNQKGRVRCFQAADRALRESGDSVFLSPEGTRITTGEIGPFNKGAFHLATSLRAPLVPIYIAIPPEANPGKGFDANPGTVHVYIEREIATDDWQLEDVGRHRDEIHDLFTDLHSRFRRP